MLLPLPIGYEEDKAVKRSALEKRVEYRIVSYLSNSKGAAQVAKEIIALVKADSVVRPNPLTPKSAQQIAYERSRGGYANDPR